MFSSSAEATWIKCWSGFADAEPKKVSSASSAEALSWIKCWSGFVDAELFFGVFPLQIPKRPYPLKT